jgi:hypothetical protein
MKRFLLLGLSFFAALPATTNYKLNSYGFGSGGVANSGTATYQLEGIAGEQNGQTASTVTYSTQPGFVASEQAPVPSLSAFDNNSGQYYNKLHFTINTQNNPTDATYALSISTDNFATDTRYVKSDLTVGASLALTDYQTYTAWGGASGSVVIGLLPSTTYYLRVKATNGKYSESAYGPVSSVATAAPSITFSVTTSTQPTPPFSIDFGSLLAGNVQSSPQTANVAIDTNAVSGASIYIVGKNNGLLSPSTSSLIASSSVDLATQSQGYGAQSNSVTQTSGGPLAAVAPYNGSAGNVGIVDTTIRSLYSFSAPIIGGSATILFKAKSATTTVAATDYGDVVTLIAAGSF